MHGNKNKYLLLFISLRIFAHIRICMQIKIEFGFCAVETTEQKVDERGRRKKVNKTWGDPRKRDTALHNLHLITEQQHVSAH